MRKTCLYASCKNPVWGGGYCKWHQGQRKDKKAKTLQRKSYKSSKEDKERQDKIHELDRDFYLGIWEQREHKCYNCKAPLFGEPLTIYFDHILEKSKYPQFRHTEENICLLCWNCHQNKTNGVAGRKLVGLVEETKRKLLPDKNPENDRDIISGQD